MRKILALIVFLCLFFPKTSFAETNFNVSLDSTYKIDEYGTAKVTLKGIIKNTTEKFYPQKYTLRVGFNDIENLTVSDIGGVIKPIVKKIEEGTELTLPLLYKPIGIGAQDSFVLSFTTKKVAKKNGNIWEIQIPGISNQSDFSNFNVHIVVPDNFGKPDFVKPKINGSTLDFDKETLGTSGISIAYGKKQTYSFTLLYNLKNSSFLPKDDYIALPPSTNYQDVYLENLNPKPRQVIKDTDGNWIATYSLLPGQTKQVSASGGR